MKHLAPRHLFLSERKIIPNSPPGDFLSVPTGWVASAASSVGGQFCQQRRGKEMAFGWEHHHQAGQSDFNNKIHNLFYNKVGLYFRCLVADSCLSPILSLSPSAPHLKKWIKNNPRHSYIWCHGALTLALSLIITNIPSQSPLPKAIFFLPALVVCPTLHIKSHYMSHKPF